MFLQTTDGVYLNPAFVKCITRADPSGQVLRVVYDNDDDVHDVPVGDEGLRARAIPDQTPSAFVPALQPLNLVEIWVDKEGSQVVRHPIVAWRISNGWPEPIAVGADWSEEACERQFIELPDGKFQSAVYGGGLYDTLQECIERVRQF